ncbi:MAG: flippase-like domain-containing protein [candidate division Zixibacteria bacterium]|nr:flippase-like domain-containing protein [candidate division Zixibacteria bacterium]
METKVIKVFLKFFIVAVILFFFIRYVYENWRVVSLYQWQFKYGLLAVSFGLVFLNFLFFIQIWRSLLQKLSSKLPFKKAFKIWFYSNLGKYVPGKIWSVMGMVYMCEKEGIPKAATLSSAILNQLLNIIGGLILVLILSGTKFLSGMSKLYYLPLILVFVISLYPRVMEKILNWGLKKLKKEPVKINLNFKENLFFTLLFMLAWGVYGVAFNIFIMSLTDSPLSNWPFLTSIFAFSYIIGFLSIFVPGGLGVREGILVYYLSSYFPLPVATLIALLSRLWMTAVELSGLLVAWRF